MSKLNIFFAISLLILLSINSCNCFCKKGDGKVITKDIKVPEFDEIDLEGKAQVILIQGELPSVKISIDSNLMEYVKAEVSGSKLEIHDKKCMESITDYKVYITCKKLSKLTIDGSIKLVGDSLIKSDELYIQCQGSSTTQLNLEVNELEVVSKGSGLIKLSGRAIDMNMEINDAGSTEAFELQAKNAEVNVKSAGSAKVFVSEKFTGNSSGSGNIYYKGNPKKVNTNISGSGTILSR
jgi:hypothetical protein